jgi:HSP20 family protein
MAQNKRTDSQLEPSRQNQRTVERWRNPSLDFWDPLNMFQRFSQQMDQFLGNAGTGREWRGGQHGSAWLWTPQIEAFQRGDQFIIRADLPGLQKKDIDIEVSDGAITLKGERREEHQEDREGFYRSERSYGSFYRSIPLPEGAITESAKASFNDGVLEVAVQVPPREVSRGRRVEISESNPTRKEDTK